MNPTKKIRAIITGSTGMVGEGVLHVGMNEEDYTKLTYTLTTNFARTLANQNPNMTFCYVSGASTDSTEKGKSMWAHVKGRTENELTRIFKRAYNFRPAIMMPMEGMKN